MKLIAVALAVLVAGTSFGKNCAPGDIDDVLARARAMAAKDRPKEAEKLLEGAWAACGKEIAAKGDGKQEARRRDFLLDWLDLAARAGRATSCARAQALIVEHVADREAHAARIAAATRRCQADRM
jgi:hypothetical protein